MDISFDDVGVKVPKSRYGGEAVQRLPGVRKVVMEHLKNLDNVLADVERAGATMSGEQSDKCCNTIKMVGFVCGRAGRWLQ